MVHRRHGLAVDTAADYRIIALGTVGAEWADRLGGLSISPGAVSDAAGRTILSGRLVDQAALIGVLNQLYDLGLALELVERLAEEAIEGQGR